MIRRRKSPFRHKVRNHVRNKRPVRNYVRGKGDQQINPKKSRVVGGDMNPSEFDITVIYVGKLAERFSVEAKKFLGALRTGIESRDESLPPRLIRMRRVKK